MESPHQAAEQAWPRPVPAALSLGVLVVAYTFSFIDRTILSMLVGPVKADLQVSDTQISLLTGIAFALFYTLLGLPIGVWVDRGSRRGIAAAGVAVWSLMTAMCGAAHSFGGLLLARIGVGAGEAALSPAAYSLIPDLFRPEHRSRAQGVYGMGACFGSGLAFLIGGWTIAAVSGMAPLRLPLLGEIGGWRLVFFVVGLPGLLVALMVLSIVEPPRRSKVSATTREVAARLRQDWRAYAVIFVGCTVVNIGFHALSAWGPAMLGRVHHLGQAQVGMVMGAAFLGPGCLALFVGGVLADRSLMRGRLDGNLVNGMVGAVGAALALGALALDPSTAVTIGLILVAAFFLMLCIGAAPAALQVIAPPQMRGRMSAGYMFALNLIGMGIGPTATAALTDFVFQDPLAVGRSIGVVAFVAGLTSAGLIALWRPHFRKVAAQAIQRPTA